VNSATGLVIQVCTLIPGAYIVYKNSTGKMVTNLCFTLTVLVAAILAWLQLGRSLVLTHGNEKEWGFGQILSLVLLTLPVLNALEIFSGK
jgi:hypothetical protein